MASREENEAVAGLLRRSLAHDASAAGDCPEPEFLAAYFEHSLDAAETALYDRHFSGCSRCRAQLAAMVRADAPKPQSRNAWLLDWRLLSAAAVVMLLVTVWLVRKPEKPNLASQPASAPLIALNKDEPKGDSSASTAADRVTAVPQPAPESGKKAEPVPTNATPQPLIREEARADSAKAAQQSADSNSLQIQAAPQRLQGAAPPNEHTLAQVNRLKQQNMANPAGAGGSLSRGAALGHATATQQQIAPSSQMVMVEPSPAQTQTASGASQSAPVPERKVSSSSAPAPSAAPASAGTQVVGGNTETVTVTNAEISDDKQKKSQPLASAYSASGQAASLLVMAESSVAKVIDTPIPSIKWRITAAGFVERSEDGGATWKGQEPDPEAHLVAGSAPTDKVCWLVGAEGVVLVTKDATNWKKIPPPVTTDLTSVSAKSASAATITTADGRRFTTHNEGKKWKPEN
jgi:hypothetical protein